MCLSMETAIYFKIHFDDSPIKERPGKLIVLEKLVVNPAAPEVSFFKNI